MSSIRSPIANLDHNVVHLVPTFKSKLKSSKAEEIRFRVSEFGRLLVLKNIKHALIVLCGRSCIMAS